MKQKPLSHEAQHDESSSLPLVLLAAVRHPDECIREKLRSRLAEWAQEFEPRHDPDLVLQILDECKGTAIEPFVLHDDDRYLATFLVRLAFSRKVDASHIQIVSRETVGAAGGCLLDKRLKYRYLERFAPSRSKNPPEGTWLFVPAEEPTATDLRVECEARYVVTQSGLAVSFQRCDLNRLRWIAADKVTSSQNPRRQPLGLDRSLDRFSRLGSVTMSSLGLSVAVDGGKVVISTGSAETLLRFAAHLVDRPVLRMNPGPEFPGRAILSVRLEPSGESIRLQPKTLLTSDYVSDWLRGSFPGAPKLLPEEIRSISDWATPHESWADVVFAGSEA